MPQQDRYVLQIWFKPKTSFDFGTCGYNMMQRQHLLDKPDMTINTKRKTDYSEWLDDTVVKAVVLDKVTSKQFIVKKPNIDNEN